MSLKLKKEESRFVDLKIILRLQAGNDFAKMECNFRLRLDGIVPNYGSMVNASFLGAVQHTFFGPPPLGEKGSYEIGSVSLSVCLYVRMSVCQ